MAQKLGINWRREIYSQPACWRLSYMAKYVLQPQVTTTQKVYHVLDDLRAPRERLENITLVATHLLTPFDLAKNTQEHCNNKHLELRLYD